MFRNDKVTSMSGNVLGSVRSLLVRGLAVVAVLFTYAATTVGTQVASMVGISSLFLATSTQPAQAQYWRRRRRRVVVVRRRRRRW